MKKNNTLIFVILFPIFFQIITYYGFQSSYDDYKNWKFPTPWYYKGIYGYRILSREVVDFIQSILDYILAKYNFPLKAYMIKKGTSYYHSLFIFNTIFAALTSFWVDRMLQDKKMFPRVSTHFRLGIVFFLSTILGFSQYVITHYDNSAIFLFLVTAYFSMKYFFEPSYKNLFVVCAFIIISTLNRETACLNISLLASLMVRRFSKNIQDYIGAFRIIIFPVLAFVLTYVVLRMVKPQANNESYYFFESITLRYNLTGINQIAGWLFGLLVLRFIYFYTPNVENKKLMNRFLIFSTPYILMIFLVGILWEIRLFVPLIYGVTILSFFNYEQKEGAALQ